MKLRRSSKAVPSIWNSSVIYFLACVESAMKAVKRLPPSIIGPAPCALIVERSFRSEEHTSELKSLMRTSYAASCLKTKQPDQATSHTHNYNNAHPDPQR